MKTLLFSLLTLLPLAASAQVIATFSCPHIFEMVDYDPEKQTPIFSEMKDAKVFLTPESRVVEFEGQTWPQVGAGPLSADEVRPTSLLIEYVALLFGTRLKTEEIISVSSQGFYRLDLAPQDRDEVQAITVSTATTSYRYLQFSHADLAICKE